MSVFMSQPRFNYIITIHNKESLIGQVLMALLISCRQNSRIYAVLDGCTDKTEHIIDNLVNTYSDLPISKVYADDVHEILSINAGLRAADQSGEGFNIILQDDVILADYMFEKKVASLYEYAGTELGFVSFRQGANFPKEDNWTQDVPLVEKVESAYGHGSRDADMLLPGFLAYRTIVLKSPVCIPFSVIRSVGLLDEQLAPYMCDDIEYSIRCIKAGYKNAVFALRFISDVAWGTTRLKPDARMGEYIRRNMRIIRSLHASTIKAIVQNQITKIVKIEGMYSQDDEQNAREKWQIYCTATNRLLSSNHQSFMHKVRRSLKRCLKFYQPL